MPMYVVLLKWTDEGRKTVTDASNRVQKARDVFKKFGAEQKAFYFTFGRYDMIAIVEAPDDAAMAKSILTAERWGAARMETLRAFSEVEAAEIIKAL